MHIFPTIIDFEVTSLMTMKCYEAGTFHSFTIDSDSGCLEGNVRMVYCTAFNCHANSSKNTVTCSWFKERDHYAHCALRSKSPELRAVVARECCPVKKQTSS